MTTTSTTPASTQTTHTANDATVSGRRTALRGLSQDAVLLVGRIGLGVLMIAHAKMTYDFGGGLGGVTQMFASQGIPLADLVAPANVIGEFVGGIAVLLGLATRLVGVLMAVNMAGAWIWVHTSGLYAMDRNGPEMVIALGLLSLMFAAVGSGRFGVDHVIARRRQNR